MSLTAKKKNQAFMLQKIVQKKYKTEKVNKK